jgi:hypothetical protein
MPLKDLGAALKWKAPIPFWGGEARTAFSEATFLSGAGSGGNDAVRSPVFEEVSSMLRCIEVLALLLGILSQDGDTGVTIDPDG